jgi:hypothetical protein
MMEIYEKYLQFQSNCKIAATKCGNLRRKATFEKPAQTSYYFYQKGGRIFKLLF